MKTFINEDFLLTNDYARELYHESAEKMPIIDYHCHLVPKMIADNYQFKDLTEVWLGGAIQRHSSNVDCSSCRRPKAQAAVADR